MSTVIPTQIEKCKGAMLSTAIGDALGWPNEPRAKNRVRQQKEADHFVEWTRSSSNPRWHDEEILAGEYSDDTQLTLSVARSIIAGGWEEFLAGKELPYWLNYERGGGSALLRAAKSYKKGILPWQSRFSRDYYNAGGNGAAMRILPHVIAAAKTQNTAKLMIDVAKDTILTHGHPRAFLGASCYAYALDYLLRKNTILEYGELVTAVIDGQGDWGAQLDFNAFGEWLTIANQNCGYDFSIEWERARERMVRQLEFIRLSLKKGLILDDVKVLTDLGCFRREGGAGDVTIIAAIYLASKYANNPSLGIRIPAFLFGADTDTIASITGGLLGMLSGINWIPQEWKIVQDYDCLIRIVELLLADSKKGTAKEDLTAANKQKNQWEVTPIGKMKYVDSKHVTNGKHGVVVIKKWETMLGQTIYTKSFHPSEQPQPQSYQSPEQMQIYQQPAVYDATAQLTLLPQAVKADQQNIPAKSTSRQFVMTSKGVSDLLTSPGFKTNITVGKVLKIIKCLMEGKKNTASIAKQFDVTQSIVEQIDKYVI